MRPRVDLICVNISHEYSKSNSQTKMIIERFEQVELTGQATPSTPMGNSLVYYLVGAVVTGALFTILLIFLLVKKCGDIETRTPERQASWTSTIPSMVATDSTRVSSPDLPSYATVTRPSNLPPSYAQAVAHDAPPDYHHYVLPMYTGA